MIFTLICRQWNWIFCNLLSHERIRLMANPSGEGCDIVSDLMSKNFRKWPDLQSAISCAAMADGCLGSRSELILVCALDYYRFFANRSFLPLSNKIVDVDRPTTCSWAQSCCSALKTKFNALIWSFTQTAGSFGERDAPGCRYQPGHAPG
jgi:hypothetical protein